MIYSSRRFAPDHAEQEPAFARRPHRKRPDLKRSGPKILLRQPGRVVAPKGEVGCDANEFCGHGANRDVFVSGSLPDCMGVTWSVISGMNLVRIKNAGNFNWLNF
jgi:hypothetical protein